MTKEIEEEPRFINLYELLFGELGEELEEVKDTYKLKEDGSIEITLCWKSGLKFLGYEEEEE